MASRKPRWKLSFSSPKRSSPHSSSPSSSPSSSMSTDMPLEFLCPISRSLMADPVIIPSGLTLERSCIQACVELSFTPPSLGLDLDISSPSAAASLVYFPNTALKSTIVSWCQRCGIPPPLAMPREAAVALVRRFMPPASDLPPAPRPPPSLGSRTDKDGILEPPAFDYREDGEDVRGQVLGASEVSDGGRDVKDEDWEMRPRGSDETFESPASAKGVSKKASPVSTTATSSSSHRSTSSYSSSENVAAEDITSKDYSRATTMPPGSYLVPSSPSGEVDASEEEILAKLKDYDISEQEKAAAALRQATRESPDRRKALCSPRLLAALRPLLNSRSTNIQINATASLVNLSLEAANKVRIVRSGAVPPLIDVLRSGHPEARGHAAATLFSLALEDENRAAMGVLGAIPPLLNLFSRPTVEGPGARHDAGMALYHLSLATTNRSKIARTPGAVRALLLVAAERVEARQSAGGQQGPRLERLAMMIVCNLAGCQEGREALMSGGGVAAVVDLMREGGSSASPEEEYCVAAMYGMSRQSLRFRGLARAAGAERVLMRVAEASGGSGEVRRDMARKTLRAMSGEDDEDRRRTGTFDFPADEDGSVVSEGLSAFPLRYRDYGNVSRLNSAEF